MNGKSFFYIVIFILGMLGFETAHSDNDTGSNPTLAELVTIAKNSLLAKNQLLVWGHTNIDVRSRLHSSQLNAYDALAQDLIRQRNGLVSERAGYEDFTTEITVISSNITASSATLRIHEHTVYKLTRAKIYPSSPKVTEEAPEHLFVFQREGGQWKLYADNILNGFQPAEPSDLPIQLDEGIDGSEGAYDGKYDFGLDYAQSPDSFILPENIGALDRRKVVNYAYTYWDNYKPKYKAFNNDCTNFVSQALYRGGWQMLNGDRKSSFAWWYDFDALVYTQSYTWAGAHNFHLFTLLLNRGYFVYSFSHLVPGAILQADWNRDGTIDHSMIVTKKDPDGLIYLTYHSADTRDRAITSILKAAPNAIYYLLKLYSA